MHTAPRSGLDDGLAVAARRLEERLECQRIDAEADERRLRFEVNVIVPGDPQLDRSSTCAWMSAAVALMTTELRPSSSLLVVKIDALPVTPNSSSAPRNPQAWRS